MYKPILVEHKYDFKVINAEKGVCFLGIRSMAIKTILKGKKLREYSVNVNDFKLMILHIFTFRYAKPFSSHPDVSRDKALFEI